ncbi:MULTISPECIES: fimbria/pilus periplasmic chaperone [Rahnella]|uniref:Fimbria/pilus periplasmic chaperone n=1 Tax=Rahnella laticis TaxID=2787622 RepID=A0ABS0DZ89_9GAMM|nr:MULTISPECIES: fimbria/pilus periplasmic chaperone [Rahnella]MBF7977886.1 fimbria/pilus periplasmic chaperone [Rahnella laticis]MBF7998397.1 fimbria/pilus periplasmic chaperone [Rahnella sp. LAC-M12]
MRFLARIFLQVICSVIVAGFCTPVVAGIIIAGTRVIYPSSVKEVSVKLNNAGKQPVLIQSWIDTGDIHAKPAAIQVPFILTPPINRVESGKGQTLRISYTGETLPSNKESVFWLNVLEIPSKGQGKLAENRLQVAFRTRIKFFYRPAGLDGKANDAPDAIIWQAKGQSILALNPTPYFVSFVSLSVNGKRIEGDMVSPYSSLTLALPGNIGNKITGEYINDYGAANKFETTLK